jgi:hypothetical protein
VLAVTYADVVGTLGLLTAIGAIVWRVWERHSEPEHRIRVQDRLEIHQAEREFLPRLRSDLINAMQFIDPPDGWRRDTRTLIYKQRNRFDQLRKTWDSGRHLAGPDITKAMDAAAIEDEISWLDHLPTNPDEGTVHAQLIFARNRMSAVLDAIEKRGA